MVIITIYVIPSLGPCPGHSLTLNTYWTFLADVFIGWAAGCDKRYFFPDVMSSTS